MHRCTSLGASVAVSKRNLVSSRLESTASAGRDDKLGPGRSPAAGRNVHVDGYQASGPGCSRRMGIGPSSAAVRMNPWYQTADLLNVRHTFSIDLLVVNTLLDPRRTELIRDSKSCSVTVDYVYGSGSIC